MNSTFGWDWFVFGVHCWRKSANSWMKHLQKKNQAKSPRNISWLKLDAIMFRKHWSTCLHFLTWSNMLWGKLRELGRSQQDGWVAETASKFADNGRIRSWSVQAVQQYLGSSSPSRNLDEFWFAKTCKFNSLVFEWFKCLFKSRV